MNIVVTGKGGYIAGKLVPRLFEEGHKVYRLPEHMEYWQYPCDMIVHLSGMTNLYECEERPIRSLELNVESAIKAVKQRVPIIYLSSDSCHMAYEDRWSRYERHKLMAEKIVSEADRHVIFRLPTVFGDSASESRRGRGVVNGWIRSAIAGGSITVYDQVSRMRRSYTYIDNVIDKIIWATGENLNGMFTVPCETMTIEEMAGRIQLLVGGRVKIAATPNTLHAIDLRDEFSFSSLGHSVSVNDGILRTADYYRGQL